MPGDAYRRIARGYRAFIDPANAGLHAVGRRLFLPVTGMRVLDVGCGTGAGLEAYLEAGCRVYGVDTSPAMLGQAHRSLGARAGLRRADAGCLPFPGDTFHLVRAVLTLHEMPPEHRPEVMGEMARVLRGDGRLLLIEHHAGDTRTLRGLAAKALALAVERAAGRAHFRHYRDFLFRGGVAALLAGAGLALERRTLLAHGHLIACLARRRPLAVAPCAGCAAGGPV
jgi:ubiquinone/menaquinone biosynthesis C-methylase UbiE